MKSYCNYLAYTLLLLSLPLIVLGTRMLFPGVLEGKEVQGLNKELIGKFSTLLNTKRELNHMATWTENEFGYKYASEIIKTMQGFERIDARLGKEIWVGDPKYPTFAEAIANIGANKALLNIPAGIIDIASDTTVPGNITLMLYPGASFRVAAKVTFTINGHVRCLDSGPGFEVNSGATLNINGPLFGVGKQVAVGPGTINIKPESLILSNIKPPLDSQEAFQVQKVDGTCVVNVDTLKEELTASGDLVVKGDIIVTGLVDGVDISELGEGANHTHPNKANLDVIDQNLGLAAAPAFAGLTVDGDIKVTGLVDGVDISELAGGSNHTHPNQASLDLIDQDLGTGGAPAFAGLKVNGNVAVNGTVDGVEVASHAARHLSGGADALSGALDAVARLKVAHSGTAIGARRAINFIPGNNVAISTTDDPTNEKVDVAIAALATGSGGALGSWLDVQAYGAKGDGKTDDTKAIQSALNTARDAGGGVVWFPKGTYKITGTGLNIDDFSNVTLDGVKGASKLYYVGTSSWESVIKGARCQNITIRNLNIYSDAETVDTKGFFYGVQFASGTPTTTDILIENCEIYNSRHYGIRFSTSYELERITVRNNYIHDCGNHQTAGSGGTGLQIMASPAKEVLVEGNVLERTGNLYQGERGGSGFYLTKLHNARIIGNIIDTNPGRVNHITVHTESEGAQHVVIIGNVFKNSSKTLLDVGWCDEEWAGAIKQVSVVGNLFYSTGADRGAVWIGGKYSNTADVIFANNVIWYESTDSANLPSYINGSTIMVSNNIFRATGGNAFTTENGSAISMMFKGNKISGAAYAFYIYETSGYDVRDVEIEGNSVYGTGTGDGSAGVYVGSGVERVAIHNNYMRNLNYGLKTASGSDKILYKNNVHNDVTKEYSDGGTSNLTVKGTEVF
ncbi:MAG: right-handed parallel beta-helix repeat-containing protein [Desulfobacteraceae bacterium]